MTELDNKSKARILAERDGALRRLGEVAYDLRQRLRTIAELKAELARFRAALWRYVEWHGPCADHSPDDCPGDCEPCAIDAAVNKVFKKGE